MKVATETATTLLEAAGIKKTYRQGTDPVEVLKGIDVAIKPGELVAIMGPSGAGKSTLLAILGGLDKPTAGSVMFHGRELYRLPDKELAAVRSRSFGFVFQFYHLVPELTAIENVALPAWIAGEPVGSSKALERAAGFLIDVGLDHRATHRPAELSGGEQQRVAIARALMNNPKIVFCDEPTGNLDSATGAEVLNLLVKIHKEQGTAFVIVTHEPSVTRVASRVLMVKDGKLQTHAT